MTMLGRVVNKSNKFACFKKGLLKVIKYPFAITNTQLVNTKLEKNAVDNKVLN